MTIKWTADPKGLDYLDISGEGVALLAIQHIEARLDHNTDILLAA